MVTAARMIRTRQDVSVAELSRKTGIPGRLIYRFERGQEYLPVRHRRAYCEALGVTPEEVFMPAPFDGWPRPAGELPEWTSK